MSQVSIATTATDARSKNTSARFGEYMHVHERPQKSQPQMFPDSQILDSVSLTAAFGSDLPHLVENLSAIYHIL